MNAIELKHRLIDSFGIIAGSISAATGRALSLRRTGGVTVADFGDGATNHGYSPKWLNLVAVNHQPVLFVCEHNLYGEFTHWKKVTVGEIIERPRVLGIDATPVAQRAPKRARGGAGLVFLEALTYGFGGHSRSDPGAYRIPAELDAWRERDPLKVAAGIRHGRVGMSADDIAVVDASVDEEMDRSADQALEAYPKPTQEYSEFRP